ncbi:MAG TPA: FHA domain-containing protein, partial [Myxococcota bacterium]|nr:FHA domain-containing protein [Myxococcota bacterium]
MANRPGPAVLQVHIFRDGEFLGTDVFAERQIVVGRDPDEADLVLESSQVSRRHAIIENEGGRVTVRDAGSTNGVFLNADKVVTPVEVTRLDEIRIGEFALKLKFASKTKGAEESAPVPQLERRPGDSTREIQAMSKGGGPAALPREERTAPRPAAAPAPQSASRVEVNAPRSRMPATASDLSEFDDIPDDPTDDIGRSSPRAEFRKRDEPVDRDKLGDMLAGIGISEPGVNGPTTVDASPLPMARGDSDSKRRGGKSAGLAELESELEGAATRTNISGFDPDEIDEPRRDGSRGVNGKSMNGGGRAYPHAHGPAVSRGDIEPESMPSAAPVQARGMPKPPDMFGLDSDPMSAFEPHADVTHDDDHDEEDDYVPTYSLAQHILGDEMPPKHGVPRVEVLAVRDDVVDSVALLAPGESYWVGPES